MADPGESNRLRVVTDVLRSFADATTDPVRLLQTIVERVGELVGHPCTVRLLTADGQHLETAAKFDPLDDPMFLALTSATIPVSPTLRKAFESKRAFIQTLFQPDQLSEVHPNTDHETLALKSVLIAPLIARGDPLGLLFVARRGPAGQPELTTDVIELVEALAGHAALALSNARLMQSLAQVERARDHERSILDTVTAPLLLLNRASVIIGANRAFLSMFGLEDRDAIGTSILEVAGGALDVPQMRPLFEELPPTGTSDEGIEIEVTTLTGVRTLFVRTRKTFRPGNGSETTLLTMVDLTDRIAATKAARRQSLMLESMNDVVIGLDASFVIEEWNPAAERLFGWRAEEVRGRPIGEVFVVSDTNGSTSDERRERLRTGTTVRSRARIRTRAGVWVDVEYSTMPLMDRGVPTGFVSVMLDITERLRLERELHHRVADLTAANAELESFSYSVSHDLRAPVRAMDGFSEILEEDYANVLDEEGRRLLALVRKNARRMGLLIDDLLALAKFSRQPLVATTVDMGALAKATLDEALRAEPTRKFRTSIGLLPDATGDEGLLRQVFVNLYANAVKYSRGREEAVIETMADETANEIVYTVKDNGAGFDMRYADKLFGTFERLHTMKEFEGTGIGLALVSRIVTRHGGRVWGEGVVERGATFHVALPKTGKKEGA